MIKGLDRINELAKKQREEGLTNAEKVEQTSIARRLLTRNSWTSSQYHSQE